MNMFKRKERRFVKIKEVKNEKWKMKKHNPDQKRIILMLY